MTDAPITWARLSELQADGAPLDTIRTLAFRHGLDLPHAPVLVAVGPGRWASHCQGCTLNNGQVTTLCRARLWRAPGRLVEPAGLLAGIDQALAMLRDAAP